MSPAIAGFIMLAALFAFLALGTPIAFALGLVSMGGAVQRLRAPLPRDGRANSSSADLAPFTLVSIPMFILMGAAVASSPAGKDLYEALDRWLNRVPGGLVLSNLGACSIFAALSGLLARHLRGDRQDGHPGDARSAATRPRSRPARSPPAARSAS